MVEKKGRYIKGGDGSHWEGCEETHWDCKIAHLESDNTKLLADLEQWRNTALIYEKGLSEARIEVLDLNTDLKEAIELISEFTLLVIYPEGSKRMQTALKNAEAFLSRIKAKDASGER
jgi:hypothetical protein